MKDACGHKWDTKRHFSLLPLSAYVFLDWACGFCAAPKYQSMRSRQEFPFELETDAHQRRARLGGAKKLRAAVLIYSVTQLMWRLTSWMQRSRGVLSPNFSRNRIPDPLAAKIHSLASASHAHSFSMYVRERASEAHEWRRVVKILSAATEASTHSHCGFPIYGVVVQCESVDATSTKKNVIRSSRRGEVCNSCS